MRFLFAFSMMCIAACGPRTLPDEGFALDPLPPGCPTAERDRIPTENWRPGQIRDESLGTDEFGILAIVTERESSQLPISGVIVRVGADTSSVSLRHGQLTARDGTARFVAPVKEAHWLVAQLIGLRTAYSPVLARSQFMDTIRIQLAQDAACVP